MFKTILVALDGSPREPGVLGHAVELAQRVGARLHLCHAVTIPIGLPDTVWAVPVAQLDATLVTDAERRIAEASAPHRTLVDGTHVRIGQAADVVVDLATDLAVELIVIGAHGYGRIERLIGTTASKIVHRASCSVLVVRPA
jgi:nucleotide-binding universal stress UspA family protein